MCVQAWLPSADQFVGNLHAVVDKTGPLIPRQQRCAGVACRRRDERIVDCASGEACQRRRLDQRGVRASRKEKRRVGKAFGEKPRHEIGGARWGGGSRVRRDDSTRTCAGTRGLRARAAAAGLCASCQLAKPATTTLVSTAVTGACPRASPAPVRRSAAATPTRGRPRGLPRAARGTSASTPARSRSGRPAREFPRSSPDRARGARGAASG